MEMNNKVIFYRYSAWILIVLIPIITITVFYEWNIEMLFYCGLTWSTILVFMSLFKNFELFKNPDEKIKSIDYQKANSIVEGKTTQIRGNRKIEGVLCLTNTSINFKAMDLEIKVMSLRKIESVKLYYEYGVFKRGITIKISEGKTERFILKYAKDWKRLIDCSIQEPVSKNGFHNV